MITPWILLLAWMACTKTGQSFAGLLLFLAVFSIPVLTVVGIVVYVIAHV